MEFLKYPKIKKLGDRETVGIWDGEVVVEEKIDGANFRFMYYDGIHWGTRKVDYTNISRENWPKRFEKQWTWVINNLPEKYPGVVFYAEAVLPHSIQYDWNRFKAPLIGFDAYDLTTNSWVPYPQNKKMFEDIGLPFVPVVDILHTKPTLNEFNELIPKSQFYDGVAEGVVLKNYKNGIFAKILSEKFIEANHSIFGKSKKEFKDETDRWFEYLFSPRRIEKIIQQLYNEKGYLNMKMMKDIIQTTIQDAVEEEGIYFLSKASAVDIRRMRKNLSRRIQNILQRKMVELSIFEEDF